MNFKSFSVIALMSAMAVAPQMSMAKDFSVDVLHKLIGQGLQNTPGAVVVDEVQGNVTVRTRTLDDVTCAYTVDSEQIEDLSKCRFTIEMNSVHLSVTGRAAELAYSAAPSQDINDNSGPGYVPWVVQIGTDRGVKEARNIDITCHYRKVAGDSSDYLCMISGRLGEHD